jgi:hypothetical protein
VRSRGSLSLMRLVEPPAVSDPSPRVLNMEERKRPAAHEPDDGQPPLKRQATSVNGSVEGTEDMPYTLDVLVCVLELLLSRTLAHHATTSFSTESVDIR